MSVDPKKGGFNSLGEFLIAVRKHIDGVAQDRRLNELISKTMTETSDSGGGFTVPEQWADEIYHAALEDSIVRSRAIPCPMDSDTINVQILLDSDRSSNIFGGITFTWLEEAADKVEYVADPKIGNLKLTAHDGVAIAFVSNQLEDDYERNSKKFEDFIKLAFGRAIAFYEDYYYIWGTGVNQPLGIMNSGWVQTETRNAAGAVSMTDIGNMATRLLPGSWKNATWLINQSVLDQWVQLVNTANSSAVLNLADMRCLGAPVIVTEKCAAMGTTGDIILADFAKGYVIGDRSMEIAGSRHCDYSSGTYGFLKNQTCWKIVLRVDGQPILSSAITAMLGPDTLSSFVALTTQS